jgi:hypothetical protein
MLVGLSEQPNRFADNSRRERVMEPNVSARDTAEDDGVDPGIAERVLASLPGRQIKNGPIDVGNGQPALCEKAAQVTHSHVLDLGVQVILPREPFEFLDRSTFGLQVCLGLQDPLRM